jgi:hypothetical protein
VCVVRVAKTNANPEDMINRLIDSASLKESAAQSGHDCFVATGSFSTMAGRKEQQRFSQLRPTCGQAKA